MRERDEIFIKPSLAEKFRQSWEKCRVIFFSAACGFGKTSVARKMLADKNVVWFDAEEPQFTEGPFPGGCDAVAIDNFQKLSDEKDQQTVVSWIREHTGVRFVIMSRGVTPGWLMPFQFTGALAVIGPGDLVLDRETVRMIHERAGNHISESQLSLIMEDSHGYPPGVIGAIPYLKDGTPYTHEIYEAVIHDLFHYMEDAIFKRFPVQLRQLLLDIAPFETFNSELAQFVSGDSNVHEQISIILHETRMLISVDTKEYQMWPEFRKFLMWEMQQQYTAEEQVSVYNRAGLYYELKGDYAKALECYKRSGDRRRVLDILVRNAESDPGTGQYYELEQYYYDIPKIDVLCSPSLMFGMSMLTALDMDYEASDHWYRELRNYAAGLDKNDSEYYEISGKLLYLDIALPHRSADIIAENVAGLYELVRDKRVKIPRFSVTSMMPSVVNGGQDLSEWTVENDIIEKILGGDLERILGRDGVGLAECAACEISFERDEEVLQGMMRLAAGMSEIHRRGTPDTEFAATAVMARMHMRQGNAENALEMLEKLGCEFEERGEERLIPNINAMKCRMWLRLGMPENVERWYRDEAPPAAAQRLRTMWRYRYVTRAMVEIARGEPEPALVTLSALMPYYRRCRRFIDLINANVLMGIAYFRLGNGEWKSRIREALEISERFGYIQPIACYGSAVLPLLTKVEPSVSDDHEIQDAFIKRVIDSVRKQAVNYPDFLRPQPQMKEQLSPAEKQVLKLICSNRSNQEIADILGVKLATVKTHVVHILQKLGVKRRSEAKEMAERLHMV